MTLTIFVLIVSLAAIVYGANIFVDGAADMARKYNVSDYVIGAVIVGIGTSFPELTVSVIGAIEGNSDVAIGNVVGSNIFNILGILGITALLFPITVSKVNMMIDIPLCLFVTVLLTLLTFNSVTGDTQHLGLIDGIVLLLLFVLFIYVSLKTNNGADVVSGPGLRIIPLWIIIIKLVFGLAVLVAGSRFFVDYAIIFARIIGVNDAFISVTLIAYGTSLPELAASITAALKKNTQMALGNIIGSNIFNITLILGVGSIIRPLSSSDIDLYYYLIMISTVLLVLFTGFKGKMTRVGGALIFLCFILYNIFVLNG